MKLSQVTDLSALTREQVTEIVFGGERDNGQSADVALLLGGNPKICPERAHAAAQLYAQGRVAHIITSGGVTWDTPAGHMSEADYLALLLKEYGVPEDVILVENESRTTHENMVLCTLTVLRRIKLEHCRRVCIVTSGAHLRRALALAQLYLPRAALISGYPSQWKEGTPEHWHEDEFQAGRVYRELELLQSTIRRGLMPDIEF